MLDIHREDGDGALRDALIANAVIYAPRHGLVDFTVPHCGAFVRRRYPLATRHDGV